MSIQELLALPAAVSLETANRALDLSRSAGYALAKRGEYPVRVLKLGNAYRVATADLHRLLGVVTGAAPALLPGEEPGHRVPAAAYPQRSRTPRAA
ncbi:integrase [Yinghuangia sp. ASG 101]|uniref:integrase n=1 Tax=Yinghuangia sp. ASG 101 TaxID=2896848 RepID=UPI001E58004A|nr:integrase [Yinghuangia sp. ASG 101]UGQ14849.1 integrase [Yinghuangia sp. ASG 101]